MGSSFSLEGKNALIVGASRGIGAEIARAFSGLGGGVALCARSDAALSALSDELESAGHVAVPIVADVRDPKAAAAVVKEANERVGSIDILVYSAGQHVVGRFEEIPEEDWRRLFEVNVLGAVSFAKAVLSGQRRRGWGRIINIASTAGKNGSMFQSRITPPSTPCSG
jgi:3-oxoacyl-[acyl-carrier protein] reductase